MIKNIAFILLVFLPAFCLAQNIISGTVKNDLGEIIEGASVTINEIETERIIAYDITNKAGKYNISFQSEYPKVQIKVRFLGYHYENKIIEKETKQLDFILWEEVTELREVVVKFSPIIQQGDTISYHVQSFADGKDRSIADVLAKMPGIEILPDGKVLYQGRPINKYYIEGLDLLEGRYNLANKNLPYNQVSEVQILENHQAIKALDSLVFSDQAALNIKLKNDLTATTQAQLGSGFSPLLWDGKVTPILFSKKQQMITSYQANNIGDNIANQLKTLTIEDLLENFENKDQRKDWMSIQSLTPPNFSEKRWLDNNAHLLTSNYLQRLKKDYDLRLNVSYLNDYQQQTGSSNTLFFTNGDTIALLENNYTQQYISSLESNLTLQKNTKDNYLKNSLQFHGFWGEQTGDILLNDASINQRLKHPSFSFSNKLKSIFTFKQRLITVSSYLRFKQVPQNLVVTPGPFSSLLNDGNDYEQLSQNLSLKSFYSNNNLSFTQAWKRFTFTPKVGIQIEQQSLASDLLTSADPSLANEFFNNLDWFHTKTTFNLQSQYQQNNWRLEINSPLHFYTYNLTDPILQKAQNIKRLTFEPRISLSRNLNAFWKVSTSANLSNRFADIQQIHYGFILKNYRNIQRINAPLSETFAQNYNLGLSYRNPVKSFFATLFYAYSHLKNNLLFTNQLLPNGANEFQVIERDNRKTNHNITGKISRDFRQLRSTATIGTTLSYQVFQQSINTKLTDLSNENLIVDTKVNTDLFHWLEVVYQGEWFLAKNKIQDRDNQYIRNQSHQLSLNIYPSQKQYLGLKSVFIKNELFSSNNNNFFSDLIYRYTWKKKNIDFEIQWNNIFDAKNYSTITIDNFSYIETNFQLRPTQVLFKVRLSL